MKNISLLLLLLIIAPCASLAADGCKMIEFPDHVEVVCEETKIPVTPCNTLDDLPPRTIPEQAKDGGPTENPPPVNLSNQANMPAAPAENSYQAMTDPVSIRQRRPDGARLIEARSKRNEQIMNGRQ